jgi:hypothetical protein
MITSKKQVIHRKSNTFIDLLSNLGGMAKVITSTFGFIVAFFSSQNYTQQIAHAMYTWVKPKSFMAKNEK